MIVGGQLPREKELTADNLFDKLTSQVQTAKRSFLFLEPKEYEYTYMYNSGFHYKQNDPKKTFTHTPNTTESDVRIHQIVSCSDKKKSTMS